MPPPTKAQDFDGDLSEFLHRYKYQSKLTRKLDDLRDANLTPELLNEIVLWKVNRYVSLDGEQLSRIDALLELKPGEHTKARSLLEDLLEANGVDLPMASTLLRFRNPSVVPNHRPSCIPGCLRRELSVVHPDSSEAEDRGLF
jgi:hypothetical protein